MFARKTRAVVWAFIAMLFIALFFAMIVAMIFELYQIHWTHIVFVVVCLGGVWIGSPEDQDEINERKLKQKIRKDK